MFRLNVLIAENNRPSLNLYRDILTKMGHEVEMATRGEAAWELFCRSSFHAVLVDYKLPEIGGDEFFARVKQIAPDVDVVLLTANNSIDKILGLVEKGVTDYLIKPVNPRRLRDMFEKVALKQKLLLEGTNLADQLGELPALDDDPVVEAAQPMPEYPQQQTGYTSGEYQVPPSDYQAYSSGEYQHPTDYAAYQQQPPVHESNQELLHLRSQVKGLEERLAEAEYRSARSGEMSMRIQELEEERDMLRRETDRLRSELQTSAANEDVQRDLDRALARTRELESKVNRQSEDLESLEEQVESRTRELEDLEKSRGRLKEALEREKDRVASKQGEIESLTNDIEETRDELRKLRAGAGDTDNSEALAELDKMRDQARKLQSEYDEQASLLKEKELQLSTLKSEYKKLKKQSKGGSETEAKLQAQIDELINELEEVRHAAPAGDAVDNEEVEQLKRKLEDLEKSRSKLMATVQSQRETVATKDQEIEELRLEFDDLRMQLESSAESDSSAAAELADMKEDYDQKLLELREALRVAKEELSSLTASATAREEAVTYLKRKLKARSEKFKVLKAAAKELEAESARHEREASNFKTELDDVRLSFDQQKTKVEQLTKELSSREERLEKVRSELDEREDELLKVRTQALQSGEEIVRNTELRFKRVIDGLKSEIESLKDIIEDKDTAVDEGQEALNQLREEIKQQKEHFALQKLGLEEELSDLREVLAEREQILRQGLNDREEEYRAMLAQREKELAAARQSGQAETERLEEELKELQRSQRKRELQDEFQSEWMELGEALVLLDEELKNKENELNELKEEYAKKERTYETTIANQRRKFKELESSIEELQAAGTAPAEAAEQTHLQPTAAFPAGESLRAKLTDITPGDVLINNEGLLLKFNKEFQECLAMDDSRRPLSTHLHEVPGAKLIRPLYYRIMQGEEDCVERPLYIRAPGQEPKPYLGIATRSEFEGQSAYRLEFFDVSDHQEILSLCDYSDARIAFDNFDTVYRRTLKITEALFSMRIVIEILIKKFKSDIEMRTMVSDVLKELDALIKLVEEL